MSSFTPRKKHSKSRHEDFPTNSKGLFTTVDGVPVRKLFVSNLVKEVQDAELVQLFGSYGNVIEASVVRSSNPEKPVFGFVTYETPDQATWVLKQMRNLSLRQRRIYISPADSWHQPIELPDGKLVLRRKPTFAVPVEEEDDEEQEEEGKLNLSDIEVLRPDESCAISKLNDDCLLLIFNMLPVHERLSLHLVCRRWESLMLSQWYGMKSLDFTSEPLSSLTLNDCLLKSFLSVCSKLTSINIATDNHKLTHEALIEIAKKCPHLEEISMKNLKMKKRTMAFLGKSCPKLKAVHLHAFSVSPDREMLGLVKNCRNLEEISLRVSTESTGQWLRFLRCPLKSLSLQMYDFDPSTLIQGISCARDSLRELSFVNCHSVRGKDLDAIVTLTPDLTHLTFAGENLCCTPGSLLPLAKLNKLVQLHLDCVNVVSDQFLEEVSKNCLGLETLSLSAIDDKYISNQAFTYISELSGLTYLSLALVKKLTDSNLKTISKNIKGLKNLVVMGCKNITDEGCKSVLKHCQSLEVLDVRGCNSVTNVTIVAAGESVKGSKKLKIIAGGSGIDLDIECPPSLVLDFTFPGFCTNSLLTNPHYPRMFFLDPELAMAARDDDFFDYVSFLDDDLEDDLTDDDLDYMYFDGDGHLPWEFIGSDDYNYYEDYDIFL